MTSFNWLHLTDLHWGMRDQPRLWPRMQEKFFRDLEALHSKSGPWDLVFFTGDLTYQGSLEEFAKVDQLLEKLWTRLSRLGSVPFLLAVPGNHDLTRPDPAQPEVILLQEWSTRQPVRSDFWNNPKSPYRRVVKAAFQNYLSWWGRQRLKPSGVRVGMLPGDFSVTLEKGAARLGIVGLNTTFLQLTAGDYQRKLALDARQFHEACGGDSGPEWARGHQVCLLLTHQPHEWLTPDCQEEFNAEIAHPGQFAAHLFGHMHEASDSVVSEGGAQPRRFWQGRSLFGLEYFIDNKGVQAQRFHGYSAGKIELDPRKSTGCLTFWPREARRIQGGAWRLAPDQSYELTEDGCVRPLQIDLLMPFGATGGSISEDIVIVFGPGERLLQSTQGWEGREVSFRPRSEDE